MSDQNSSLFFDPLEAETNSQEKKPLKKTKIDVNHPAAIAEVIESSLTGFLAQSWHWDSPPSFGSLLTVVGQKRTLFGVVHEVRTGSTDPQRHAYAYKKTHEELQQEQPQIFELLKTTFSCVTLGYQEKGHIYYQRTPEPPLVHSFVSKASAELARQFFSREGYLHILFGQAAFIGNLDELLLAILAHHKQLAILTPERINKLMHLFSLLTANDYRRIKLFLQRTQPLLTDL